jgi:hypothetical protein
MPNVKFSDLCHFTDKQLIATAAADAHRYMLFGGARGPGKSYWLRWWLVRFLMRAAAQHGLRGVRVMLACEDYPSLYERQISKVQTEFPPQLGRYMAARNEFVLAPQFGSGVIAFRNLDDPSKYQSAEFAAIAVDEITKNPEKAFHILRSSLRWPAFEGVRFVAASNPEANWVRSYWIEKLLPEEMHGTESDFAFVPALPDDNPHLPSTYWQMLDTLPGAMRAAWRYGDWYAAVEGLVYDNFSADNLTDQEPIAHLPFEVAIDDGYIDPRAVLFIQRQPGGDVLVFDELYQTKTLEEKTIADIVAKRVGIGKGKPDMAVVSHEAVALRQRITNAGIPAINWLGHKVAGGKSTRLAAITLTRSLICDGQGHRAIKINRRCKHLIDEISAGYKYPEGKHGLEAEPQDGNDHACQALESWVWARMATSTGRRARVGEY